MWSRRSEPNVSSVLERLRRQLSAHVFLNNYQLQATALTLCITGPTGDGKTFNVKSILKELKVSIFEISASAIAHHKEGMALFPFIRSYRDASSVIAGGGLAVVLVDDMDRSIAYGFEGTGHTIHSQLLTGLIMDLCDNPYSIPHEGTREMVACLRVPIIFTANQVSGFDAALRRPQRMTIFNYKLTETDRLHLLRRVFYVTDQPLHGGLSTSIRSAELGELTRRFPAQPIAFFADIVSEFWKDIAVDFLFEAQGSALSKLQIEQRLSMALEKLTLERAIMIGEYIAKSRSELGL